MREIEFERALVDLAQMFGWRVASFRPAQTKHGWRTPVKYDGKGYPDLTLTHERGVVIFAELKIPPNKPSDEQLEWAKHLTAVGVESYPVATGPDWVGPPIRYRLWIPAHADEIAAELSFGRVTEWQI